MQTSGHYAGEILHDGHEPVNVPSIFVEPALFFDETHRQLRTYGPVNEELLRRLRDDVCERNSWHFLDPIGNVSLIIYF